MVGLVLAYNILRFRTARGGMALLALTLAASLWSFGYALEIASPDLPTKLFWAKIEYLGIIVIPLAWLIFSAQYSGNTGWLEHSPGRQILLWIIPVLTLCLVWTNEEHHLVWRQVGLVTLGNFAILSIEHGPWFWVLLSFSYCLLLVGSIWLAAAMIHSKSVNRRTIGFVLIGIFIPWVANLLYLADLNPIPYLDWTPFAFILAGVMFSLSLSRFHLLNIIPIAQKTVFDGLADAVLVLDTHDGIVDLNPAALKLLGRMEGIPYGEPFTKYFPELADRLNNQKNPECYQIEVPYGREPDLRFYNLRVAPLFGQKEATIGRLVTLNDITQHKRDQAELEKIRDNLEKHVSEQTAELEQTNLRLQAELAQRALAENRFEQIVQLAPDAMFLVGQDRRILLVNDQAQKIFGYSKDELYGQDIQILLPRRYHGRYLQLIEKFLTKPGVRPMGVIPEIYAAHKNGKEIPVDISLNPMYTQGGIIVACVVRDISERKQAEQALKESEYTYRVLFENASDAILLIGYEGSIIKINPKAAAILGYTTEELAGMTIWDIIAPDEHQNFEDRKHALLSGQTFSPYERKYRTKSGEVIPMEINVAMVPDAEGNPRLIQSIGRDITERKKAEQEQIRLLEAIGQSQEQLRALTFYLQDVQETERRQIAGVLHDRVGQNLTGLNLTLQMIQNQLKPGTNPIEQGRLNEALQIVEEITRQVRDVMVDLHPPVLEEYGLFSALDWYSGVFSQRTGMTVLVVGGEFSPRLPLSVETVLFRIAQEALNNVAKHARARQVTLRLESNGNGPCLEIEDDGLGFNTALINTPSDSPHWGLLSMQERAASVGGQLTIHSDPGVGTHIQVNLGS